MANSTDNLDNSSVVTTRNIKVTSKIGRYNTGNIIRKNTPLDNVIENIVSGEDNSRVNIDNNTIIEDADGKLKVDVSKVVILDSVYLKKDSQNRITIDKYALLNKDQFYIDDTGRLNLDVDKLFNCDNKTIAKDAKNRLFVVSDNLVKVKGNYILKDQDGNLYIDETKIDKIDNHYLTKNNNIEITINKDEIVTINDDQVINSNKKFQTIESDSIKIGNSIITKNENGSLTINNLISPLNDSDAVNKQYVDDKFDEDKVFETISLFETIHQKTSYSIETDSEHHCEVLKITSSYPKDKMNLIIDWGDNNYSYFNDLQEISDNHIGLIDGYHVDTYLFDDKTYTYYITHIYDSESQFTINVYGNTYYGIHHDSYYPNLVNNFDNTIFADCVNDISDFCINSNKLTNIQLSVGYQGFRNIINADRLFKDCNNLVSATGFNCINNFKSCSSMFHNCLKLETCDFRLINGNFEDLYNGCSELSVDLEDLIPSYGFNNKIILMTNVFKNCEKLTCSNFNTISQLLWNDDCRMWYNINNCFVGCSVDLRSNIPYIWGGTRKLCLRKRTIVLRNFDDIYSIVSEILNSLELNLPLNNDNQLYTAINSICKNTKLDIVVNSDNLLSYIDDICYHLGANLVIQLF